jgi:hypothetical protein
MDQQLHELNKIFANQSAAYEQAPQQAAGSSKTKPGQKFDIYKCDYPWVDACTDKREMRLAYECMRDDGGFPDLTNYCLKKLK